jgi:hypothetical protein
MSRTITVSEQVYQRLAAAAKASGYSNIEQLLEQLPLPRIEHDPLTEDELQRRREVVARTDEIYEELSRKYGTMPDSVELIREDRER